MASDLILFHALKTYPPENEILKTALIISFRHHCWILSTWMRPGGRPDPLEPAIGYLQFLDKYCNRPKYMLTDDDLLIIAYGMVVMEDQPEYRRGTVFYSAFDSLYNRLHRHLGKEFLY